MTIGKMVSKQKYYSYTSLILNAFMAFSSIMFLVYLIAPLFGGKLLLHALIIYVSWIGMGVSLKFLLRTVQKKGALRAYQLIVISSYIIVCIFLWFSYPLGIPFSILVILGIIVSYRKLVQDAKRGCAKKGRP